MTVLWPRIAAPVARALLERHRSASNGELAARAATSHPTQTYATSGGARVDSSRLTALRESLIEVAGSFGFPGRPTDAVAFDRAAARHTYEAMPMAIGEALNREVWSFTSLVLAPDLTHWRFGFTNAERWICSDRTRHMFSRLWWQAYAFVPTTEDRHGQTLLDALSESDLNQLLERTAIGGCRPLVRALAGAIVALPPDERNRDVVRNAPLRLLRLLSVVDPYSLHAEELNTVVSTIVRDAVNAVDESTVNRGHESKKPDKSIDLTWER